MKQIAINHKLRALSLPPYLSLAISPLSHSNAPVVVVMMNDIRKKTTLSLPQTKRLPPTPVPRSTIFVFCQYVLVFVSAYSVG